MSELSDVKADLRARIDFNTETHGDDPWWRGHVQGMKDALYEIDRVAVVAATPDRGGGRWEYRTISENGIDIREFSNSPITMTDWERENGFHVERRHVGKWEAIPSVTPEGEKR